MGRIGCALRTVHVAHCLNVTCPRIASYSVQRVLAIETSCDDTAAAVVDASGHVLAEEVAHQFAIHAQYKGIVPHLATQSHRNALPKVLGCTLRKANCMGMQGIDAIAVTRGPGIAGSLAVGFDHAHTLAAVHGLPIVHIHHMVWHTKD